MLYYLVYIYIYTYTYGVIDARIMYAESIYLVNILINSFLNASLIINDVDETRPLCGG